MKCIITILLSAYNLFVISHGIATAQLTGVKNIPGDYASVSTAVTILNTSGVGAGGVTFNVAAGHVESITSTISVTASGTSGNPVVFQKSGVGANPLIIAYSGGTGTPATALQDGIWAFLGSDHVTIDGIDLSDTNSANPATMEYGIGFFKVSGTNGCQYNTIKNCTITLNRMNNTATVSSALIDGSVGIQGYNSAKATSLTVIAVTSVTGANSNNTIHSNTIQNCNNGIGLSGFSSAVFGDSGNDIGGNSFATGNSIVNFGGGGNSSPAAGINVRSQLGINISYNLINSNNGSGINHTTTLRGIFAQSGISASAAINNNRITLKSGAAGSQSLGIVNGIGSAAAGNTVNINSNRIENCEHTPATTGEFIGIQNTAAAANVNINYNVFQNNFTNSSSGAWQAIYNTGAVTSSLNVNDNQIGNDSGGAVTFNSANSASNNFIRISGISSAMVSVCRNNFQGINFEELSSGNCTFISVSSFSYSSTLKINSNRFTNLNINSNGIVYFVLRSASWSATSVEHCDSNAVVNSFYKGGTDGTVTFLAVSGSASNGSIKTCDQNNFSHVTVSAPSTVTAFQITDGTSGNGSYKMISNNTAYNVNCGGSFMGLNVNGCGVNSSVESNTFRKISGSGSMTGIYSGSVNQATLSISSNVIDSVSTSGTSVSGIQNNSPGVSISGNKISNVSVTGSNSTAYGIYSTAPSGIASISRNKIYSIEANNSSGSVIGINLVSGTSSTLSNNFIGDLRTPSSTGVNESIRGINVFSSSVPSTFSLYYNTVYLNATSSGSNFSSTCLYHYADANSALSKLELRNNIIVNLSTPNGSGRTVAFRRSGSALANYGDSSNRNLFYAGAPGSNRMIYFDGASFDTTIAQFKIRVSPRDDASVTENPSFISTIGSSSDFLHLNPGIPTYCESRAENISGITDDFDGVVRQGNPGYTGTGTSPDIGADEGEFIPISSKTLNLTMYIQGFYDSGTNTMTQDTVRVYLRSNASPFAIIDSAKSLLNTNGTGIFTYYNISNGIPYFIQLKHRNSVETWSDSGKVFDSDTLSFDFTFSDSEAYGNNMIQIDTSPVEFGIYSGDVNQDGFVDATDMLAIDNDASAFVTGYVDTDLTGDLVVDASDALIADNNSSNFVSAILP